MRHEDALLLDMLSADSDHVAAQQAELLQPEYISTTDSSHSQVCQQFPESKVWLAWLAVTCSNHSVMLTCAQVITHARPRSACEQACLYLGFKP